VTAWPWPHAVSVPAQHIISYLSARRLLGDRHVTEEERKTEHTREKRMRRKRIEHWLGAAPARSLRSYREDLAVERCLPTH
jgi:hypothetical protein